MPSYLSLVSWGLLSLGPLSTFATACQQLGGLSYCEAVDSITYTGVGSSGSYKDVTHMDGKTCACNTAPKPYSGVLAPIDEEMSLHFRGPLDLKKVAVYYPSGSKQYKRATKRDMHLRRHSHLHHRHGNAVAPEQDQSGSTFKRTGYYDAASGVAQGLVFLNHMGGQGSGVWDTCFGNSLSYASSHCDAGSSKPETLADIVLGSNKEMVIFSDEKCSGNDCGYYREGIPAYHGFDGKEKAFVFEFSMPADANGYVPNQNLPSIWGLNAKIPRTSQYSSCSCWNSGCGEFDFFEVIQGAPNYVKSHCHSSQGATSYGKGGGGSPNYFERPFNKAIKAAVIFEATGTIIVKILPDSFDFSPLIQPSALAGNAGKSSVFRLPS